VSQTTTLVSAAGATGCDLTDPEFMTMVLDAIDLGLDIEEYLVCRAAGVSHAELLDAQYSGIGLVAYTAARAAGASVDEISQIGRLDGAMLYNYANCRALGLLHGEAVDALRRHTAKRDYFAGRAAGATHHETMAADRLGLPTSAYAAARAEGLTHEELVGAFLAGIQRSP
jgi:hypothetical protein